MASGVVQQIGKPQDVYDDPVNLFVAKFLGTPAINVFAGEVKGGHLFINGEDVLPVGSVPDAPVTVGIRPEGFVLQDDGPFTVDLVRVEVMGRDTSVVSTHPSLEGATVRSIISAENKIDPKAKQVHFALKSAKVLLFNKETEERIRF